VSLDLARILEDWPYEPGQINVRIISGDDAEPKIQVRLDLGVLQMNLDGRPDGVEPHGYPSYLEYYEQRIDTADGMLGFSDDLLDDDDEDEDEVDDLATPDAGTETASPDAVDPADPSAPPDPESPPDILTPEDCRLLRDEAAQFYHRYVALLVLEDYEGVVRDTTRNLRVVELCAEHAATEEDRRMLMQVRPYILMMRARALASQALEDHEPKAALLAIDDGLDQLRTHFSADGAPEDFENSSEVQVLRSMREALMPKLPVSQKAELRQRLREAIERENYELAAILRDELRQIKD
jgi:hypothetical protein